MTDDKDKASRWIWRIVRWAFVLLLMAGSFAAGAAVTGVFAIGLAVPVATIGFSLGLAGLGAAGMTSVLHSLYAGDSATRLTTLQQLDQVFVANPNQPVDPQLAKILLPALRQCQEDPDWQVAFLASQLADRIELNLTPTTN